MSKPIIISDNSSRALFLKKQINIIFRKNNLKKTNIVIVVGGDGFMLKTLKKNKKTKKFFYGVNSGNYGFLMNKFSKKNFIKNINKSKLINISPLEMVVSSKSKVKKCLAINEVSILRQSRQAANLKIKNKTTFCGEIARDGVLVSTPAEACL